MAHVDHKKKGVPPLPSLPPKAKKIAEQFESGSVLGASLTIRMISEILRIKVNEDNFSTVDSLCKELNQLGDYFIKTRGELSPAVNNAINWILCDLEEVSQGKTISNIKEYVNNRTLDYERKSIEDINKISKYGANLLNSGNKVMAYDYSSSVNAVLQQTAAGGKFLTIVIPESRGVENSSLNILDEMIKVGHKVLYILDTGIGNELRTCNAVFVGAESLTADGGFWTTEGTCSLAILANYYNIPFYVTTELLKIDPFSYVGKNRKINRRQIRVFEKEKALKNSPLISYDQDDLEFTPRELITSYITEEGIIPPEAIWSVAHKYILQTIKNI